MILCLPLLMFQGRAQEAIDLYLDTFPDAELLEVMHHPEGTKILDSTGQAPAAADEQSDDTAAMETVVDWETTLVATAQLKIGGQVLMIQDSLVRQDFDFTPSISVAVVGDTAEEFSRITQRLSTGGAFLMEPGQYDFAANFAWGEARVGVTWQVNRPRASAAEGDQTAAAQAETAQARAPDWSSQPVGDAPFAAAGPPRGQRHSASRAPDRSLGDHPQLCAG